MDSIEFPIVVEGDGKTRKRKRNDKNSKRARMKIEKYNLNDIFDRKTSTPNKLWFTTDINPKDYQINPLVHIREKSFNASF